LKKKVNNPAGKKGMNITAGPAAEVIAITKVIRKNKNLRK
jgi:hypothetical protein